MKVDGVTYPQPVQIFRLCSGRVKESHMAMLALPTILLVLLVSVLYGCWWLLPVTIAAIAIIAAGYYSWRWAGRVTTGTGGFTAWWTANQQRFVWAMSIFVSLVLAAIIVWCLVHRFVPPCTGGCLSQPSAAVSVSPADTTFTVMAGKEWSELIPVPLGASINWERENKLATYQFQTQTGATHTRQSGPVEYTNHGRISSVRFRTLETEPVVIRVLITR